VGEGRDKTTVTAGPFRASSFAHTFEGSSSGILLGAALLSLCAVGCASSAPQGKHPAAPVDSLPVGRAEHAAPSGAATVPGQSQPVGPQATAEAPRVSFAAQGLARRTDTPADHALREADAALAAEDFALAKEKYTAARRLAPADPAPLVGLARVAMRDVSLAYGAAAEDVEAQTALELTGRALALDVTYLPGRFERGRLLLATGRADEALPLLERCAAELPNDAEAQSSLAVARLATGDVDSALSAFERAVRLEPSSSERNANLGTAYMMRGDVERAIFSYETALRIERGNARIHSDLGTAYLAQGDLPRALEHLTRAVALEPERATFASNLAYAHLVEGKNEQALAVARRATMLDPALGSAWLNLSIAEARRGDLRAARRAVDKALELDPTDPRAKENSAELAELEARAR
jgi:tetratricopeptide (TPR) repeat protein